MQKMHNSHKHKCKCRINIYDHIKPVNHGPSTASKNILEYQKKEELKYLTYSDDAMSSDTVSLSATVCIQLKVCHTLKATTPRAGLIHPPLSYIT